VSHPHDSTPETGALPSAQTVTLDTPQPLIASALHRGFAASLTPLYDLTDVPAHWRKAPRWVPWIKVPRSQYGRHRQAQRALLKPTGAISYNAAPSIRRSFDEAAEIAKQLGFNSQDGGLCYILPPINDAASTSALFFTLPPFTIAPGPIAAALGSDVPTPIGPFTANALEQAWLPANVTPATPPAEPGWQPATVTPATKALAPGWQPAELTISSSSAPASWRDMLAQLDGTYAYLQEFKTWCRLRVAPAHRTREAGHDGRTGPSSSRARLRRGRMGRVPGVVRR
jgi:hypothetical protein